MTTRSGIGAIISSVKWRVLIWIALVLGAVTVAGLGVDIAVAGPDKAAVLAGIIVGFCEVLGVVLAAVGWAGERRSAVPTQLAIRDNSVPESQPTAGGRKYVVDSRYATGVQVGDVNVLHIEARPERS
jgi:hypothetical protein